MADSQSNAKFQFYINRQGPKGNQGQKGDTGFSPSIEVDTNTAAEYRLKIINEDNEIITDNLRGSAVEDLGGTYMRYNRETQAMYAGTPDSATDISAGVVRIANEEDIERMSADAVVTAGQVADALHIYLKSSDNSVIIAQDNEDFKTDLKVDFSGVDGDISGLDSRVTGCESAISSLEQADIAISGNIGNLQGRMTTAEGAITSLQNDKVDKVAGKGLSTNDFTDAEEEKLMHAVVDEDLANVAFTGDYDDLINKPSIPTVTNMMTVDTTQDVTGSKTFTGNTLNVGNGQGGVGSVAHYDSTLYPTTETDVNRAAGVVLGSLSTTDLNTLASQWMFEYDDSIQGYRHAQIFNDFNLTGGTNVAIIRNATTGKHEIVAHDTIYSSGNGIDINNANQVSVKVDGTTVNFNSSGELEVIGGGGATIDDTQTSTTTTYSSDKITNTFLPLTGGSITGNLGVSGRVDATLGGFHTLGVDVGASYLTVKKTPSATTGSGVVLSLDDAGTNILINAFNNNITFGLSGCGLRLIGSETRPKYNGNDLALYSDVSGGGAVIDDTQASSSTVYSSNKTDAQIMSAYTALANNVQNYYLTQANAASTYVASTDIRNIVKITETAYNNLQNPDANTFYVVVPDPSI